MFIWKTVAEKNMQKQQESRRLQWVEITRQTITENTRQFLRLAAIPLVWAIKAEMLKEN